MPAKQPATTTFTDFITAAASRIPDPALAQQFNTTFGQFLAQQPSTVIETLDSQTNNNVLLHRDYSRIVSEQRAEAAALAQREQELQHLQASSVSRNEYDQLQQQLNDIRARAEWVDTLRTRLDEMDLTELVLDSEEVQRFKELATTITNPEDNKMPDPATQNNGQGQQPPAGTPMPVWQNGQWYLPMTAPNAAAQPPAQFQPPAAAPSIPANFEELVTQRVQAALGEILPPAMAQVYGASSQTALEMQGFAAEWQQLKGESIDPRQLNQEFVNSGKQFNEFLEDKFKLSEAREAKRTSDFQAAVDAAAEQKLQQRLSEMTASGGLRNGIPANPGSTPLFDAIASRPNGLRQAYQSHQSPGQQPNSQVQPPPTPQAAPAATTVPQQPATPPPNPADISGLEAAAAALASGTYANARFDPTRPMGAPGMA